MRGLAAFARAFDTDTLENDTVGSPSEHDLGAPAGGAGIGVSLPPERSLSRHRGVVGIDAFPHLKPGGEPTRQLGEPAGGVGLVPIVFPPDKQLFPVQIARAGVVTRNE